MLVKIVEIIVSPDRPPADPEHVKRLIKSMGVVGVFTAITINEKKRLISGLHRLEAAKAVGLTEIECTVCPLEGLEAELAELDADVIRKDISGVIFGELLLKRKKIYEMLHPETKAGTAQAIGMHQALGHKITLGNAHDGVENRREDNVADKMSATLKSDVKSNAKRNRAEDDVADKMSATLESGQTRSNTTTAAMETPAPVKSFVEDTAEKMHVTPRTVRRQLQTAKNLDADAGNIIKTAKLKISKKGTMALSRLEPDKQREAASMLVSGEVKSVGEYTKLRAGVEDTPEEGEKVPEVAPEKKPTRKKQPKPPKEEPPPFKLEGKRYATFAESVADLKNVDKDVRCTPDIFLAEITETIKRIRSELSCYLDPGYREAFPDVTNVQFQYLQDIVNGLRSDLTVLLNSVKELKRIETPQREHTGKDLAVNGTVRASGSVRRHPQPVHQQTDFRPAVPTGC